MSYDSRQLMGNRAAEPAAGRSSSPCGAGSVPRPKIRKFLVWLRPCLEMRSAPDPRQGSNYEALVAAGWSRWSLGESVVIPSGASAKSRDLVERDSGWPGHDDRTIDPSTRLRLARDDNAPSGVADSR